MSGPLGIYGLLIPLVVFLPLAGFALTALIGRRLGRQAHWIPVGVVVLSWLFAMAVVVPALGHAEPFGEHGAGLTIYEWIPAGDFTVEFGFFVDSLTACLLIVVTTVGMLVHVYSIGYMGHDPGYWRFFAYLNLFMFSMLLLVLADSWLVVFVAWELVGLCSYLLIGFWYRRRSAALAAKKAFIVNRVGDVGFALGIMAIFVATGTLDIRESIELIVEGGSGLAVGVVIIALLIFAGAVGKSAQFPLHVWLPDAMEGPTPVSALIHAATMVNAGVYLVARSSPIFASAPEAMLVVAGIGIFTAILAASIAMTQTDIKRVLAYSTLSQLGYMFAALGVGAWTAAIFHLMAHGFFKGLLFLDSGSVIHAVADEQDMRRMGGLGPKIPITYATMFIGSLAIAGIPPLAGFFSKDEILGEAFKLGFMWVWLIGIVVAFMTAFYMFRLMGLTFWGSFRGPGEIWNRVRESPRTMTVPLVLLAIPSVLFGLAVGLPLGASSIAGWLEPVFAEAAEIAGHQEAEFALFGVDGALILTSVFVATVGLVIAGRLFGWQAGIRVAPAPERVAAITASSGATRFLYRASLNKWWFDEIYDLLFIRIGGRLAEAIRWFDERAIDGLVVNGTGRATVWAGTRIRTIQTGRVQNYALGIAIGLLIMAGSFLVIAGQATRGG
ncbi:MAG TPA: NADH-quinone oxidoreductase subunit L [Candidatus Limnocylindrales bacterium]|nr:NADH-quinone oxidoreductase subunit L [Candidatus Limnocylindrales bacterium]